MAAQSERAAQDANRVRPDEEPFLVGRTVRSLREQQRRLSNHAPHNHCEHCGLSDKHFQLRVCSACGLALYCSTACQKAARGSHRRICNIVSVLPSRDVDKLALRYDGEKMIDLNAGLRYATKYMSNLKHLEINLRGFVEHDAAAKISAKKLTSLLRSKKGALDSVCWFADVEDGISRNGHAVWRQLHDLTQLRLHNMFFDDIRHLFDIIGQQKNRLTVLSLKDLRIAWSDETERIYFALAIRVCKSLVKLDLEQSVLLGPELEIMLNDLPNIRSLNLERNVDFDERAGFTDETLEIIARKCPRLHHLNVNFHNRLTATGIRKIRDGCIHLRSLHTTTCQLSRDEIICDVVGPELLCLSLFHKIDLSEEDLCDIIEATGGCTLIQFTEWPNHSVPVQRVQVPLGLAIDVRDEYGRRMKVLEKVSSKRDDPEVANEWECIADL